MRNERWLGFVLVGIVVAIVVFAWDGSCAVSAQAARPGYPITAGEWSRQTCSARWLLHGKRPSVFRHDRFSLDTRAVPKRKPCTWDKKSQRATRRLKFLLGFPNHQLNGSFGLKLRNTLLGKRPRPRTYLVAATKRQKAAARVCTGQGRILALARRQIGVRETGTNDGRQIRSYQYVTGAYRAPWCASFVQWLLRWGDGGTIADRSAGVFYIVGWSQRRGWIRTRPLPGDLSAFMDRLGHIGIVEQATRRGYWTIEGNASNSVLRRFHPYGSRRVLFIRVPAVQRRVKCVPSS